MTIAASFTDIEEYKYHWWQIGGKHQTSQTACKLSKTDIQIAPFLAAALLIMSNLIWGIKFSPDAVMHMA